MIIDKEITDHHILREGYIHRDGFIFTFGSRFPPIMNRLVIRIPNRAHTNEQFNGYSYRTLDEHIELINQQEIRNISIISDNIDFIRNCPSVRDVEVFPSYDAKAGFDYSPLYDMCNVECLDCKTMYGTEDQYATTIDYSHFSNLRKIGMVGQGHLNFNNISSLEEIWISGNHDITDFSSISSSKKLRSAEIMQCKLSSLRGIENCNCLEDLHLSFNRKLEDITSLDSVAATLKTLSIDSCPRIKDFSILQHLTNLEHLELYGNNLISNLNFLTGMKNLKTFTFTMNVKDGNLNPCMNVPYVSCKNRKHYNLKDRDLPKK